MAGIGPHLGTGRQAVDQTTPLSGAYSFRAPGWYGSHRLRVVAPSLVIVNRQMSAERTVRVKVGYRPRGKRSDWSWLGRSGPRWDPRDLSGLRRIGASRGCLPDRSGCPSAPKRFDNPHAP